MPYLVKLTERALRDLESIYEYIHADTSEAAFAWFNELSDMMLSLERFPNRGTLATENKKVHHLFFGEKTHIYRIIYTVDPRRRAVNVLHIRHGARAVVSQE
jgi:toxin ParE1/3/4